MLFFRMPGTIERLRDQRVAHCYSRNTVTPEPYDLVCRPQPGDVLQANVRELGCAVVAGCDTDGIDAGLDLESRRGRRDGDVLDDDVALRDAELVSAQHDAGIGRGLSCNGRERLGDSEVLLEVVDPATSKMMTQGTACAVRPAASPCRCRRGW